MGKSSAAASKSTAGSSVEEVLPATTATTTITTAATSSHNPKKSHFHSRTKTTGDAASLKPLPAVTKNGEKNKATKSKVIKRAVGGIVNEIASSLPVRLPVTKDKGGKGSQLSTLQQPESNAPQNADELEGHKAKRKNVVKHNNEIAATKAATDSAAGEAPTVAAEAKTKKKNKTAAPRVVAETSNASTAGQEVVAPPASKKTKKNHPRKESPRSEATTEVVTEATTVEELVTESQSTASQGMNSSSTSSSQSPVDVLGLRVSLADGTACNVKDFLDMKEDIDSVAFVIYPKANTPGCTRQCVSFSERKESFAQLGVTLVGVSNDTVPNQQAFMKNQDLTFPLVAKGADLMKVLNSITPEGKTIRSVVAVDRHGNIFYEKHKVSPDKSAEDFLKYLRERDEPPTEIISEKEETVLQPPPIEPPPITSKGRKGKKTSPQTATESKKTSPPSTSAVQPTQIATADDKKRGRKKAGSTDKPT